MCVCVCVWVDFLPQFSNFSSIPLHSVCNNVCVCVCNDNSECIRARRLKNVVLCNGVCGGNTIRSVLVMGRDQLPKVGSQSLELVVEVVLLQFHLLSRACQGHNL